MQSTGRLRGMAAVFTVAVGLVASGCATTASLPGHARRSCGGTLDQDGPAAPPAQVQVVCRWAAALRSGNVRAAAAYFRVPSLFEDGPGDIVAIHTLRQATLANETLTCGAEVLSAFRDGQYIDVLFRLTTRSGPDGGAANCAAKPGTSARTAFIIRGGRIAVWVRTASRPGDPGTQTTQTNQSGGSPI